MLAACQASTTRRQPSCSPLKGRWGLRYRRFAHAADAIGYAIEKLSDKVLAGLSLHVNDEHYNAMQIRALYESERYPLSRKRT